MFSYSHVIFKEEVTMTVREGRKQARYTQDQAAAHRGVSRPTYAKIEANPDLATVEDAKAIAALFGVKVEDIFFDGNYS